MKIIALHSDFIEITPKKKAIKSARKVDKGSKRFEECLVVLSGSQSKDESNPENVAQNLAKNVEDIAEKVNVEKVVLYPYVHLVSKPSNPQTAKKIMSKAEEILKKDFEVEQAPFGWYKEFSLKCKGHPLSELSREFGPEKEKERERPPSEYKIMDAEGEIKSPEEFNFKDHKNLKLFWEDEEGKRKSKDIKPPHIKLMKSLELVDHEPASEFGNFRWYPKGVLVKRLLEEYVTSKILDYGALEVETPVMYAKDNPIIGEHLDRFPERQFKVISGNNELFLRYAACFGQFLIKKDMILSYRNLPLKLYELTKYSFRREKSGEAIGLKRTTAFTMPDMHTVCRGITQAKKEFIKQHELEMEVAKAFDLDFELVYRLTKDFFKKNKGWLKKMVKSWGKPILLEILDYSDQYWIVKNNYVYIDNLGRPIETQTVQIDVENAKKYGITYTDKDNSQKTPVILHTSPGGIERLVADILENAAKEKSEGKNPTLPLWLSPTQVRICPVSDEFIEDADKLAKKFEEKEIRVDVDDRTESIGKKVSDSQQEWIPYVIVYGDKEKKSKKLPVRIRRTGKIENKTFKKFVKEIKKKTQGKPYKRLPLARHVSERPIFVG